MMNQCYHFELLRLSCEGCFCLGFVSSPFLFNNYIQQKKKKAKQKRTHKSGVSSNPSSQILFLYLILLITPVKIIYYVA